MGTKVMKNLVHEVPVFGKQVCAYVQSLACETELTGNIFFNGARAGINFNDGFGGDNAVKNNLLFNFVCEALDHGNFNSWDRQLYMKTVKDGKVHLRIQLITMNHNHTVVNTKIYNPSWLFLPICYYCVGIRASTPKKYH